MNPPMNAYTIVTRNGRSYWTRIGSAIVNRDESISITLDALPVNGTIHLRKPNMAALEEENQK
jgi:hypothetical protein